MGEGGGGGGQSVCATGDVSYYKEPEILAMCGVCDMFRSARARTHTHTRAHAHTHTHTPLLLLVNS